MNRISIVIVNWNTGPLLTACLTSLASLAEKEAIRHVVIVDNASKDESLAKAERVIEENGYILIREDANLGFSKANNIGMKYIYEHGGEDDHILLLNPDTEVEPQSLERMAMLFDQNQKTGIVGPKLVTPSGEVQHSVRTFPTLPVLAMLFLKLQRLFPNSPSWKRYMMADFQYDQEAQVDQVMGAAFLIRNTLARQLGGLDESFWIWFEEVDYCKQAKDSGWNIIYTPSASIVHHGGVSFNQLVGIRRTKPFLDSAIVYARKHLGAPAAITLFILYPAAILIALAASLVHIQQKNTINSNV